MVNPPLPKPAERNRRDKGEVTMRDRLAQIFNALMSVETKGDSTLILADCMRELLKIVQEIDKKQKCQEDKDGVQ